MARIAIGGFGHETNSFVAHRADYVYFADHRDRPPLVRGDAIFKWLDKGAFPITSFMSAMKDVHELVPLLWAHGAAGGPVTADAFERIAGEMIGRLSEAMPLDAVYLDLHGAMASEPFEDSEGELLRRVRATVGNIPVIISLDYHANITPRMVEFCDGMVVFQTYPHVDRPQTGLRTAKLLSALIGKPRPAGRAIRNIPFLIPTTGQCTLIEPSKSITAKTRLLDGDILTLAYAAGFPPSDLYWCGPAVVAYAANQAAADKAADDLYDFILSQEKDFQVKLLSPAEGVEKAIHLSKDTGSPVVLADVQDNPGGGGSGDTTGILNALIAAKAKDALIGIFTDAEAAAAAHAAGEGSLIEIDLGGRNGPEEVKPLHASYRVQKLGSGKFRTTGSVTGGLDVDLGPMALLEIHGTQDGAHEGIKIVVASKRMQAMDLAPFLHLDADPAKYAVVVVKSAVHFRAEFAPFAKEILLIAAPGKFLDNPEAFSYKHLRPMRLRPMGPMFGASHPQEVEDAGRSASE